jgi:hypothetical protein
VFLGVASTGCRGEKLRVHQAQVIAQLLDILDAFRGWGLKLFGPVRDFPIHSRRIIECLTETQVTLYIEE